MCGRDSVWRVRHGQCVIEVGFNSQTGFYLLYINHGTMWPLCTRTPELTTLFVVATITLLWSGTFVTGFINIFVQRLQLWEAEKPSDCKFRFTKRHTLKAEIIRAALTAGPPVNSLYGFCVNTDNTQGNNPRYKTNPRCRGRTVNICFVCCLCEHNRVKVYFWSR